MKPSHPSPFGFLLPLLPAVLMGVMAATGSGKALLKSATRSGWGVHTLQADTASVGLPFGEYGVDVQEDVPVHDERRNKDLPVTVVMPRAPGPFPVIVLSHGAGGDGNQNRPLASYWASHGYVVLCPTHKDSLTWQRKQAEAGLATVEEPTSPAPTTAVDGDAGAFGIGGDQEALRNPRIWLDRAEDVSCIIDSLDDLSHRVPALSGRIDKGRVGVGGVSWLGATTAQIVGGAPMGVPGFGPANPSYCDMRARAVLLLTSSSGDYLGLPRSASTSIAKPLLMITGTCHRAKDKAAAAADDAAWVRTGTSHMFGGVGQYRLRVQGSHPMAFGGDYEGLGRSDETGKGFFPYVEETTLSFWDASLKQDTSAHSHLVSAADPHYTGQFGITAAMLRR